MMTIHQTRSETQGFSISRRDDGIYTLHTWHKSGGITRSLPQVYMTEQQMLGLFDDIGQALIGTATDALADIITAL